MRYNTDTTYNKGDPATKDPTDKRNFEQKMVSRIHFCVSEVVT